MLTKTKSKHLLYLDNLLLYFLLVFQNRIYDVCIYDKVFKWCTYIDGVNVVMNYLDSLCTEQCPYQVTATYRTNTLIYLCQPSVII